MVNIESICELLVSLIYWTAVIIRLLQSDMVTVFKGVLLWIKATKVKIYLVRLVGKVKNNKSDYHK